MKKTKKKIKYKFYRLLLLFIITIFSFIYSFSQLYKKIDLKINNEKFINYLISDSFGTNNIIDVASLNSMQYLFKYSFNTSSSSLSKK